MANDRLMSHDLLLSVTLDLSAGGEKIKSRESDGGTQAFKMLSNKLWQTYQSREAPAATTQPTCIGLCSSSVIRCKKKKKTNLQKPMKRLVEMSLDGSTSVSLLIMILTLPITSSRMWRSRATIGEMCF